MKPRAWSPKPCRDVVRPGGAVERLDGHILRNRRVIHRPRHAELRQPNEVALFVLCPALASLAISSVLCFHFEMAPMSGLRRLAIFISAAWLGLVILDGLPIRREGVLLFGVAPLALVWGVWWVWRGFRTQSH